MRLSGCCHKIHGATGPTGATGATGNDGTTPTVAAGTTTTVDSSAVANVTQRETATGVIFDFTIPRGVPGADGITPTVTAGTTTTVDSSVAADVTQRGTATDVIFDFIIPRGLTGAPGADGTNGTNGINGADGVTPTLGVGETTTVDYPDNAIVTIGGTPPDYLLNFQLPRGPAGPPGPNGINIKMMGSSSSEQDFYNKHPTGFPGETWLVEGRLYTWDDDNKVWLDMGSLIGPQGEAATITIGTVTTIGMGSEATVTNSGTVNDAVLDFGIPGNALVYRGNLSTSGSTPIEVPLGKGLIYRVQYAAADHVSLYFIPSNGPTYIDYKVLSHYDVTSHDGVQYSNRLISSSLAIDTTIFNNAREMHKTWIRVQDPDTSLWSMYEVNLFSSAGGARVTIWVNTIEEGISY